MSFELENMWNAIKEGTQETTEAVQDKISEFHENYISDVLPDCGKYGDAAKFIAEMVPGVSEYNAIVEGDWTAFAIAAGIDTAAILAASVTAGTGFGAVKGTAMAAKLGTKAAVKEIAEAGVEKVVKETVEAGVEKIAKETVEAGAEKIAKETVEAGAEKIAKETVEVGSEKAVKEVAKEGVEKTAREATEKVAIKRAKEVGEKIDKKLIPEYLQEVEKITNREIKPQQLEKINKALENQDFAKLDPEKLKLHKKLFNNARDKLITEWEKNTGEKWPEYTKDILNEAGEIIRKAGQRYDAHHLIEASFGGPNAWWNLHPAASPTEHQAGIHAATSLAKKIF